MCDFSLQTARSRRAKVGDRLTTRYFDSGTTGFVEAGGDQGEAICLMPGTELALTGGKISVYPTLQQGAPQVLTHRTAIFRQVNKGQAAAHHDALEFPDGRVVLLTLLVEGQPATVLQLPAPPKTAKERSDQERVEYAG
jgi:hypothetical protein